MAEALAQQAAKLPRGSGVYLFKTETGEVLYVGKAKDLRARVRQYLSGHDERFMVRFMLASARHIEVVLTDTEKEALILENTLIKAHSPRYNVKLRDDKNFLHLRLDRSHEWPRYTLVRRIRNDRAQYFGPYSSAQKARRTLAFLERSFPIRSCTDSVLTSRRRPCLLHQMHRCVAPCVQGLTTPEAYTELVDESVMFLEGRNQELQQSLERRMHAAAEREDFEEAARLRDLHQTLRSTVERQKMVDRKLADRDVWGLWREGQRGTAVVMPVREGKLLEPVSFPFTGAVEEDGELLSTWLNTWYDEAAELPPEVLLPTAPDDAGSLAELLSERRGRKLRINVPKRGEKLRLIELARHNARDRFRRNTDAGERRARALQGLADLLGLETPPHRIECFDNSNLQGSSPVASQVVFLDGVPAKSEYRTYRIKTVSGSDDYASMEEVLDRRFRRGVTEGVLPDLLVVDGGRGQLGAAQRVLGELGLEDQVVIGLAKPRTERRRGEVGAVDKIILPDRPEPVRLADRDPALNLLRQLRDESHRFAIRFHRRVRRKSTLGSVLEALPGVGPARRKALLRHFGSAKGVLGADIEQLATVAGIGPRLAEDIHAALHPDESDVG